MSTPAFHRATITSISTGTVRQLLVRCENYQFQCGQYTLIELPGGLQIPLSIASSPHTLPQLAFHYRSTPGYPEAEAFDALLEQTLPIEVSISNPQGDVITPLHSEDLLVVAAGTGAAQAFASTSWRGQHGLATTTVRFCVDEHDNYAQPELASIVGSTVYSFVDAVPGDNQEGLAWLNDHPLDSYATILLCGGPDFVYAMTDLLEARGVPSSRMHSDVYSYAPR